MDLREYFGSISGHGVLASADKEGRVDVAIYSRPYVIDDTMVAFIMADHLTRRNLLSNPSAAYLFKEPGERFEGKRLYLTMMKESGGDDIAEEDLKAKYIKACEDYSGETLWVMYFKIERIRPLIGDAWD